MEQRKQTDKIAHHQHLQFFRSVANELSIIFIRAVPTFLPEGAHPATC